MSDRDGFCDICGKTLPLGLTSCDIRNWELCRKRSKEVINRLQTEIKRLKKENASLKESLNVE